MRQVPEATIVEQLEAEKAHGFERCILAFTNLRYEIVAHGGGLGRPVGMQIFRRQAK